jgi:hypothetical protein
MCGRELDEGMLPIHPTESADTVSRFAAALRGLGYLEAMRKAES